MARTGRQGRKNIYFRQTPKEFKSAKQAEVYEHIKMNIPYRIFAFTKRHISNVIEKTHGHFKSFASKLPKEAKKVK